MLRSYESIAICWAEGKSLKDFVVEDDPLANFRVEDKLLANVVERTFRDEKFVVDFIKLNVYQNLPHQLEKALAGTQLLPHGNLG